MDAGNTKGCAGGGNLPFWKKCSYTSSCRKTKYGQESHSSCPTHKSEVFFVLNNLPDLDDFVATLKPSDFFLNATIPGMCV